jgi:8-oxo-dGTP pyrophosphatase MutT (NUDIX family)
MRQVRRRRNHGYDELVSTRHSVSVAAVVTNDRGDVLVIRRRDNGQWQIPGGALELNESIHAGLVREVQEETGVRVEPGPLTGVYKNLTLGVVGLVFAARIAGGSLSATEEAAEVAWWSPARIQAETPAVFAIRVADALAAGPAVAVRTHDGVNLLD